MRTVQRSAGGARAARGERRSVILDLLRQEPDGYTADRIYELLGVTENRGQKAVYATLHNMKRKGQITQQPDKRFVIAGPHEEGHEPAEETAEAEAE
jgi:Fe2+ or Zn2+ uptake regulation protein